MRDGDFTPESMESTFNTLMGDVQVVDKVIVPRNIPENDLKSISPLSTSSANLDITSMPSGAPIDIILPPNPTSLEPFDKFNPIEKSADKEIFMKNPHYMNYEILDFMRNYESN
jgi:hypothetical protein